MALHHLLQRREMRKAGRAALEAIRLVRAVRHEVDAELALRRFDGGIRLARRYAVAFREQLEVMNERFHVALHLLAAGRGHLVIGSHHRTRIRLQPLDALTDDAIGLAHLLDAYQVAVVAIAVDPER